MRHACVRQNVSQQVRLTVPVADLDVRGGLRMADDGNRVFPPAARATREWQNRTDRR
jgi:hypothetical protein